MVDNHLPSNIKRFASKNLEFKTISYQSELWYQIHVPSFNQEYVWKEFDKPKYKERWYTWGNTDSICFTEKAMHIELTDIDNDGIVLDFMHSSDNTGQTVEIRKSYLSSIGITSPYFEWGHKKPWKVIPFTENNSHYFINPEHFSSVGIHEASDGVTYGEVVCDFYNYTSGKYHWVNTTPDYGVWLETLSGDSTAWQKFRADYHFIRTIKGVTTTLAGKNIQCKMELTEDDGEMITWRWYNFTGGGIQNPSLTID